MQAQQETVLHMEVRVQVREVTMSTEWLPLVSVSEELPHLKEVQA